MFFPGKVSDYSSLLILADDNNSGLSVFVLFLQWPSSYTVTSSPLVVETHGNSPVITITNHHYSEFIISLDNMSMSMI